MVIASRDLDFIRLSVQDLVREESVQIIEYMDDHGLRTGKLEIDFQAVPGTIELNDPHESQTPNNVARDPRLSLLWSSLLNERTTLRRRAIICVSIPMGQDTKVFLGSTDVSDPKTLRLF